MQTPSSRVTRTGARLSQKTQAALHLARDHAANALAQSCTACKCAECTNYQNAFDHAHDAPTFTHHLSSDFIRNAPTDAAILSTMQAARAHRPVSSPPKDTPIHRAASSDDPRAQLEAAATLLTSQRRAARQR